MMLYPNLPAAPTKRVLDLAEERLDSLAAPASDPDRIALAEVRNALDEAWLAE